MSLPTESGMTVLKAFGLAIYSHGSHEELNAYLEKLVTSRWQVLHSSMKMQLREPPTVMP